MNNRLAPALLLLLLALAPASGQVDTNQIEQLFQPYKKVRYALCVRDLDRNQLLVETAIDRPQKPASVAKLFVAAAALNRFGPDFALRTRVYLDGQDLLIVGGGDPGFGDERLADRNGRTHLGEFDQWAATLKARGVERLGRIALDDTIFEREFRHPDWPDDQAQAWYQAPVGGLNLNDNCLDIRIVAGGGQARAEATPRVTDLILTQDLVAAKTHRPRIHRGLGKDVIEVRGTVSKNVAPRAIAVGVPALFFGSAVEAELEARGITVAGQLVRRTYAPGPQVTALAEHATPLPDLLWRMNTHSQNMFAEALLKSLAAYDGNGRPTGETGSWDAGRKVLRHELADLGVSVNGAIFRDGSGLSHDNRVTARQITDLLAAMWRHPHRDVFVESLATPGTGTMRRYRDPKLKDRIHGKTGTISGVRGLAGFVQSPRGPLAFALLIEGNVPPDLPGKICRVLVAAE